MTAHDVINTWQCPFCDFCNASNVNVCAVCEGVNPVIVTTAAKSDDLGAQVVQGIGPAREKRAHQHYIRHFHTKVCPNLECGCANTHQECFFSHTPDALRRSVEFVPNGKTGFNYLPVRCQHLAKVPFQDARHSMCPDGLNCCFAHVPDESLYHPLTFKIIFCNGSANASLESTAQLTRQDGWQQKTCKAHGPHCWKAHGQDDRRDPSVLPGHDHTSSQWDCVQSAEQLLYWQLVYKTEPCTQRPCKNMRSCPKYHHEMERRRNPAEVAYSYEPCPHVKHPKADNPQDRKWKDPARCPQGDKCLHAHTLLEQMYHPHIFKTSLCANFMAASGNRCQWGLLCTHAHGNLDLRSRGQQPEINKVRHAGPQKPKTKPTQPPPQSQALPVPPQIPRHTTRLRNSTLAQASPPGRIVHAPAIVSPLLQFAMAMPNQLMFGVTPPPIIQQPRPPSTSSSFGLIVSPSRSKLKSTIHAAPFVPAALRRLAPENVVLVSSDEVESISSPKDPIVSPTASPLRTPVTSPNRHNRSRGSSTRSSPCYDVNGFPSPMSDPTTRSPSISSMTSGPSPDAVRLSASRLDDENDTIEERVFDFSGPLMATDEGTAADSNVDDDNVSKTTENKDQQARDKLTEESKDALIEELLRLRRENQRLTSANADREQCVVRRAVAFLQEREQQHNARMRTLVEERDIFASRARHLEHVCVQLRGLHIHGGVGPQLQ